MARVDLEGKLDMALIVIDGPLPTAASRLCVSGPQKIFQLDPLCAYPASAKCPASRDLTLAFRPAVTAAKETPMTSRTTLIVMVAPLRFGGAQLHGFAMSPLIGILVGTYLSIYLASS